MIEASIPTNEPERLKALAKLRVLDTPIEERFERITRMICRLLNVPISSFTLVDESRQWFKSIQGINDIETPRSVAFCAHAILEDEAFIVADASKDERFADNPLVTGAPHIASYAGIPVRSAEGFRVGTICAIDRKPRDFTADEIQLLRDMGAMVESELRLMEVSKSHEQLEKDLGAAEKLALVDPLTRIWNRAGIMQILEKEWAEATRAGNTVGILSLDIDHFKKVNDTFGHPFGDVVIRETARRALMVLRNYDALGRMGGEEFMAVMPGVDSAQLKQIAERILEKLRAEAVKNDEHANVRVTISVGGIEVVPTSNVSLDNVLRAADKALYRAKGEGRDRYEGTTLKTLEAET